MIPTIHSVQLDIMNAQQQEIQTMMRDVPITRLFDQNAFQELASFTKQVLILKPFIGYRLDFFAFGLVFI